MSYAGVGGERRGRQDARKVRVTRTYVCLGQIQQSFLIHLHHYHLVDVSCFQKEDDR